MPSTVIAGLQEALWMYPENQTLYGPWPDSGEIDYGEFYSNYSNADIPAIHYPGSANDPNANTNGCTQSGTTPAGQFNTYALMWTPTTNADRVLQRCPLPHRHLRLVRGEPRHRTRAVRPALLHGVHLGLGHQQRQPQRFDAVPRHDEDRLGQGLAVLTAGPTIVRVRR